MLLLVPALLFTACESDTETPGAGHLRLHITDAPLDAENITGVYITFSEIHYKGHDENWHRFDEFDGPVTINLLDLTRGETDILGFFELEAGTYSQLRFILLATERGQGPPSNPQTYLEFEDGTTTPLFVPSGEQTGYKAIGHFSVPANGHTEVTADFDIRRSVVRAGASGLYLLKPTIRLIVNEEAGRITGEVTSVPENTGIVVYAYESGTYTEEEAAEPEAEQSRFPGAVNTDMVDEEGIYHIDFLAPGSYDLVVASTLDGEFEEVLGIVEGVTVESGQTTVRDIDLEEL